MTTPFWNLDLEQMQHLASEELKENGPVRVTVYSPDGSVFLSQDKTGSGADGLRNETFAVWREIFMGQQRLGTIRIVYDDRIITGKLLGILVGNVVQGTLLILMTCGTLYVGLSRVLLVPLRSIFNTARVFGSGDLSARITQTSNDELGALAETFNSMADGIEEKIKDLQGSIADVNRLKSWLSDIIDSLPSIIVGVDHDGRVNLWNQQAEKFAGILSPDAKGREAAALLPGFSNQLQQAIEVIDSRVPYRAEKILIRSPEQHYYDVQIYPLVTESGGQAVIRIDDVTEQARIEEIMMQTEKMMMVGGLAAGMAHEINNPLGAILQNAQNIERRISPDLPANIEAAQAAGINLGDVHTYLENRGILGFISHIRVAGSRASKIITNMLKFSRKSESRRETADISEVLEQVLELASNDYDMKKSYDFKHIQVVREFDTTVPPIVITVLEIEQVLLNIIKNAAQAMSAANLRREPVLTLRTRRENEMAVIEIEDNGPGMDGSTQRRIFEPFFTTKAVGVGTGLGLSVSYAIITNNHKGSIEVESKPGEGARFIIRLPIQGGTA
jgi:PAS domain S-box-containing protein